MQSTIHPDDPQAATEMDAGTGQARTRRADCWIGLSRDVIERFMDVIRITREISREARFGYKTDLCALESWMQGTTGHTIMTADTAELWTYFRKAMATGLEPRLLDRLLLSMQEFYAYAREGGFREDDPAAGMPQWVHRYFTPAIDSPHSTPVHTHA